MADDYKEPGACTKPDQRHSIRTHALTAPSGSTTRGLGTLGNPEYTDQPTWLAAVPQTQSGGSSVGNPTEGPAPSVNTWLSSAGGSNVPPSLPAGGNSSPAKVQALAHAVVTGSSEPQILPFWMESAIKLGTRFLRVAAAGVPEAALGFVPHGDEPKNVCCCECGREHPVLVRRILFLARRPGNTTPTQTRLTHRLVTQVSPAAINLVSWISLRSVSTAIHGLE